MLPASVTLWLTFVSCQYELKNLIRYGIGMDLGIENEALAFAVPYVLGFIGAMYALLGIFTITKWKQSQETIRNLWKRTLVATPLLIVIFAAMHFGAFAWGLLVGIFAVGAHREYCTAIQLEDKGMRAVGMVVIVATVILGMDPEVTEMSVFAWAGPNAAGLLGLSLFLGAFATWAIPIIQDRSENVTSEVGRALIGFVLIWFFIHGVYLMHLGEEVAVGAAIFAVLNVAINDSMALVFGRIFGKNKFRPVLSPKKTWEGVFGGLFSATLVGYLAQPLLPQFTSIETAGIAVVLAIIGTMGDLMLSALKRDLELKDWSQMLPGHGGILDRVDSFILVAPAIYWMMLMLGA